MNYPLLNSITYPDDLRRLSLDKLPTLVEELRAFLLESVSKTGGHLSSNLGTVELTVALHYVFNTPTDRLVWDVGHQTYVHKILTGRREGMARLRMKDGVSGFPRRCESHFDTFGVGHSSTSISAALGMAVAVKHKKEDRRVVAIIGDGAMSAGQAFEAMNNAGVIDANLLVILNDNDMSISPPVGALNNYLARLLSGRTFNAARRAGEKVLATMPSMLNFANRVEEHVKGMITPGTLFEELGFNYIGPIDGHDLDALIPTLLNLRELSGPQFLHIVTRKGQGYKLAEADPVLYHGVSKFDTTNGIDTAKPAGKLTYTQVFGTWLCDMAAADSRLMGITPAMREGSGLVQFEAQFPERYFDVGIAEQHALTYAAGLACEGLKPVVAIYSTFLQRAYDQLIHDIALQNLDVTFAIDRGGLVGADGGTHNGAFDLSYMTCVPNMVVMAASDEVECRQMLTTAYHYPGPAAVRYPRGSGPGLLPGNDLETIAVGKGLVCREGSRIAILAFGAMVPVALAAGETLGATVVNMRFVKPIDQELLARLLEAHEWFVTVEENSIIGGAGSEVARAFDAMGGSPNLLRLGLPDEFIDHGDTTQLLKSVGLDAQGITGQIQAHMSKVAIARHPE
jgi:1-deoxy-D-xylulose-5-phosphate synthase